MTRKNRIAAAVAGAFIVGAAAFKVSHTPEWTVLTGSTKERQIICRSVYKKAPWRATWALERLLNDEVAAVRITAIEALERSPELHERFAGTVDELADRGDDIVRARALEYIFKHPEMLSDDRVEAAATLLQEDDFRNHHAELLSFYLAAVLERGNGTVIEWMLDLVGERALGDTRPWESILRYPDLIRTHHDRLVQLLADASLDKKSFIIAALTAAHGEMRGTEPADWAVSTTHQPSPQAAVDRFTVEMEWASRIHPNFHIATHEGRRCLYLGEGAGGYAVWRRDKYHTVDIGQAQFTFTLAESGHYQIWCNSWFSDKCGNHALLYIDDTWFKGDTWYNSDSRDPLRKWHWKQLQSKIFLEAGPHTLTVKAADDGLFHDQLALLPAGETFDPAKPPPLNALYDPSVPCSISITPDYQSQSRDSTQTVAVWIRRNSPDIRRGSVTLEIPPPFRIVGAATTDVTFADRSPIAQAEFRVELPADSTSGEVRAKATFTAGDRLLATGGLVIGVNFDWYTTGPLNRNDPLCVALLQRTGLSRNDLDSAWKPFPQGGYDKYRRLNFEHAFGQASDAYIFLYTEIEVSEAGSFESFLTIDDMGYVFVGDQRVAGRDFPGVGEGKMHVDTCHLKAGRHPVFAWVYQSRGIDSSSGRSSPNHWVFKWLLRDSRQLPAAAIKSVAVER